MTAVTATKTTARTSVKVATLGTQIDTMWALREKKREINEQLKAVEAQISEAESKLFERLDAEDTTKSQGKAASVSVSTVTSFSITDFDTFAEYVRKNKYFHLFQRRVSDTAAREIFEQKGQLPGLTPFTKRTLNLRSLKS